MQFTPSNKLSPKQLESYQLMMRAFQDVRFYNWFLKADFTELGDRNIPNAKLWDKYFADTSEYPFKWYIVKRPWYKRFSSVIGQTTGSTVTTYTQIFDNMTPADRAGHLAHELMHVAGFSHSFNSSITRDNSLPYQVGNFIEGLVKSL